MSCYLSIHGCLRALDIMSDTDHDLDGIHSPSGCDIIPRNSNSTFKCDFSINNPQVLKSLSVAYVYRSAHPITSPPVLMLGK